MNRIHIYHVTVFVASFLLFQLQPMTAKTLAPVFGGSYLVWGACMVFYQLMLLLGYAYAHAVQRRAGVARYARWHCVLLALPLVLVPLGSAGPGPLLRALPLAAAVMTHLLLTVGLPAVALSTSSVVLQSWLSASRLPQRGNPYVLYGASNLGALLGLLSYPLLTEPLLALGAQRALWWAAYAVTAALHIPCRPGAAEDARQDSRPPPARPRGSGRWFLLAAAPCAVLVATSNVITLDVAAVPLLWVPPLAVYLLAFALAFGPRPPRAAPLRRLLPWAVIAGVHLHLMSLLGLGLPAAASIPIYLAALFAVTLACARQLVGSRPDDPRHLTRFYLVIAAGGLAGSFLASWVAPLVSAYLVEYPAALLLVVLALAGARDKGGDPVTGGRTRYALETAVCLGLVAAAMLLAPRAARAVAGDAARKLPALLVTVPVALALRLAASRPRQMAFCLVAVCLAMGTTQDLSLDARPVVRHRNYYGVYRVFDRGNMRYLQHGTSLHGREYVSGPRAGRPLSYYHATTPIAEVLRYAGPELRKLGMIGLGAGAMAAHLREGQSLTVYELDPDNLPIAARCFSYLAAARRNGARVRIVTGDGRLALRNEPDGTLDLLVIDAFSSGSIPVHLITLEAFGEYFRVLRSNGLLLLHVSRKVLDLEPVVHSIAEAAGLAACGKTNQDSVHPDADSCRWMALSRDEARIATLTGRLGWTPRTPGAPLPRPWTDRYSNILGAMF